MSHDEIGVAFHSHQMRLARSDEIIEEMLREVFEERAAIREFCGDMPREEAERLTRDEFPSLFECMKCYPKLCKCRGVKAREAQA